MQNPLGPANPLGGPTKPNVKLEEVKQLPKEFKNEYLERLAQSKGFTQEIDRFEQKRVKLRNRAVEFFNVIN